jgi:hypothetical protein
METPPKDDSELEKLREEYLKQLLDRYEARSKTFRSLLFGFLGFGSVFLLLIVIPFSGLRRQQQLVSARLEALAPRAGELATAVEAYGRATEGFRELQSAIAGGPDKLKVALPTLFSPSRADSSPGTTNAATTQWTQQSLQRQSQDECASISDEEERRNCRVAKYVRQQFEGYATVLDTSVIKPIEELPAGVETRHAPDKLRRGLNQIQAAFEARLKQTPRFWELYSGKVDFYAELRHDLDRYWKEFGLQAQLDALVATKRTVDSEAADLKARKISLESQQQVLAVRLAQLESPIGKLPIGLTEGVQVFPLLMAVGLGWCWLVLGNLVQMRRALRDGYSQRARDQAVLTDRHLSLIAPLSIGSAAQDTAARVALFALIAIYVVGCGLVAYLWFRTSNADDASAQVRWLYGTLYIVAAVGLVVALRRMLDLFKKMRPE